MIGPVLRKELLEAVKTLNQYDHPAFAFDPMKAKSMSEGLYTEIAQPYRMTFSRVYDKEKGKVTRTLSISWIVGKPFSDADIPEWKELVEEAIGTKLGMCGFMFVDQKRIYCLW